MDKYIKQAHLIIKLYSEGSDLDEEQNHVLYDTANEHNQILSNVIHTQWFKLALAENLRALDCF